VDFTLALSCRPADQSFERGWARRARGSNRGKIPYRLHGSDGTSVSFPGFPVPDFPGSRRFCHSRFPGKSVRDSWEYDLLSKNVYSSGISGIFHQLLQICLKIHSYVHATSCKEPRCTMIKWQLILHLIS
jgi:hypothetical protein